MLSLVLFGSNQTISQTACVCGRSTKCFGLHFLYNSVGIGVTISYDFWVQMPVKHRHLLSEHDQTGVVKSALLLFFLTSQQFVNRCSANLVLVEQERKSRRLFIETWAPGT